MWDGITNGTWVDAARTRMICATLLAGTVTCYSLLVLTGHGTLDWQGRPIGTDFSDVYAAGWMADRGQAAGAWAWADHYAVQQALQQSATVPFYGWHYPPPFLLIAALLATMPYLPALVLWQGTTLAAATLLAREILSERWIVLAVLAAPATFVCLGHGQNAFLTASLLGGGLWFLDRRPWLAGLLLGCLIYKPQFAVVLPIAFLAGGWRVFLGAIISSLALCVATLALWGWPVWQAFFDSLPATRSVVIDSGETGWEKIISAFAAVRALGVSVPLAYAVQATVTALALAGAGAAAGWGSAALRNAAICCAALLSTPYALDYDLVILGAGIIFLVADTTARGWLGWERSLLAFAYLAPLIGRQVASLTLLPLNWIAIITVFALVMRRVWAFDVCRAGKREAAEPLAT